MPQPRERMDYDVVVVGGGPAGLATALHLKNTLSKNGKEAMVCLIEKASEIGAHNFSGAVMDPRGLDALVPDWRSDMPSSAVEVVSSSVKFFTQKGALPVVPEPPPLHNHGNFVVSLANMCRWLAKKCEAAGVDCYPGFAASDLIYRTGDDGQEYVDGVRIGDMGIGHDGKPKANYTPGMDIGAKIVVLTEGARGHLTKQAIARFGLDEGRNEQLYAIGFKEVWKIPDDRLKDGTVIHTMGYPQTEMIFGGGFIYKQKDGLLHVGYVVGLDYQDPRLDPYHLFQAYKSHPFVHKLLDGGELQQYGARVIGEGGYWAMPKRHHNGLLLAGESAGFLNGERLKGIHLAIESGIMAAETAYDALQAEDYSDAKLAAMDDRFEESPAKKEMWKSRNFRQGFEDGFYVGLVTNGLRFLLGGKILADRLHADSDAERTKKLSSVWSGKDALRVKYDGKVTYDRLTALYTSNTKHEEDQPCHLVIADTDVCNTRCKEEYGNPCQFFCPAQVYEMVDPEDTGETRLQVNFSNCVHCKTCDIKDPYQIINWVPPEGSGGPGYQVT